MLKLSKFGRGNYKCFKAEIIKARNAQLELLITGCGRLSPATANTCNTNSPRISAQYCSIFCCHCFPLL